MKTRIISLLLLCLVANISFGQTRLWITGSAVPGGLQELEKFAIQGSTSSCFKFHGTLLPGDLYIVTTDEPKASRYYYKPKLVDSNIVNDGIAWTKTHTEEGSAWAVLFEASNYRFTIDPATNGTVKGELFPWWYEAILVGGCTADNQGVKEGEPGHWQLASGKFMEQNPNNPYEWTYAGELKSYTANDEPKRFKIVGQYGWGPKSLQAMKQDAPILTATQVNNGGSDYKWAIGNDGFYFIRLNVFTESIHGEYYKDEEEWTALAELGASPNQPSVSINGRSISLLSDRMTTASLYRTDGACVAMQSGTQITLNAPAAGAYLLHVEGPEPFARKVVIE